MTGWLCSYREYEYKGLCIEKCPTGAPWWPIKKDGFPYVRLPAGVEERLKEFYALTDEEREACYVGGGCERI